MALQKQPVSITFGQGLDTKTDEFQVPVGKFLELKNSVFTKANRLTKRNGFKQITRLPNTDQTTLTTLNDNLIATGSELLAFSQSTNQWLDQGIVQPVQLEVQSLVRNSSSQVSPDSAISANGLICLAYMDDGASYYQISDKETGQQIVNRTLLPFDAINPRVFLLGPYFIITFFSNVAGTATLQYVAVPTASPDLPQPARTISSNVDSINAGYDGYVVNNTLYAAWAGAGGASVRVAFLTPSLVTSTESTLTGAATLVSVTADASTRTVWVTWWDSATTNGYSAGFDYNLVPIVTPTQTIATTLVIDTTDIREITSIAADGHLSIFYEVVNSYGFTGGASSDYIAQVSASNTQSGGGGGGPVLILQQPIQDSFIGTTSPAAQADAWLVTMPAATLSSISVILGNSFFQVGPVYIDIYDDTGAGASPGTLIGSSDPIDLSLIPVPPTEITFNFTAPVTVSAANYYIVVRTPATAGYAVNIGTKQVTPQTRYEYDGIVWTLVPANTEALYFKLYSGTGTGTTIVAQQATVNQLFELQSSGPQPAAIGFLVTMPSTTTISTFTAKLLRELSSAGNIHAEIWSNTSGTPTALLATSTPVNINTIPLKATGAPSEAVDITFTFPTPQAVTSGTGYFFILYLPDPDNNILVGVNNLITSQVATSPDDATWTPFTAPYTGYYKIGNTLAVFPPTATVSPTNAILRSVGLASKAFMDSVTGIIYIIVVYGDTNQTLASDNSNQSTYFLIDSTGKILMRLAYANGGGYMANQVLPSVNLSDDQFNVPYMITDFLTTVNKGTNLASDQPVNALYTQTGINLAQFSINVNSQYSSEIANALHLTGGQLWEYDGVKPVEHGFHVWPENTAFTSADTGGFLESQLYFYTFTYEWTDNQGMLHRSAPSIPMKVDLTASATDTNEVTLYVPTLRLTYKVPPNPVRIVGYRWSVAQQSYYQFTSVTAPVLNDTTIDYVTIVDDLADSSILGTTLLYTTGGVVENIAAPASIASALFNNRLFLIDAEDPNLLWFSKQVIESVPVEMSDLLTLFVAPTTGAQGSTGPMTALSAMDDKLIIFKQDAIYYITGAGPDNTGANSTFSEPVFITATVGCANPRSIVLMPNGLMFQSDKGIWLLGRDLQTQYIGAPVERYNDMIVTSATAIPGTNQVRFIMFGNQITLVYDYFFAQWSLHSNVSAISATLYQGSHTYLNRYGQVFQETPGLYLDGSTPVLMSFTTSWYNIAGLQGYERFYFANLLGTYITPFILDVAIAYDYNPSARQSIRVLPDNFAQPWGGENVWGGGPPWGGDTGNVFSARLFPEKQKCQSFQLTVTEVYDRSMGQAAGEGLTLSGLALVVGMKRGYRTQSAKKSFG